MEVDHLYQEYREVRTASRTGAATALSVTLVLFILLAGCEQRQTATDCEIDRAPCTKQTGALSVAFDIVPKPVRTMSDLVCRVALTKGAGPVESAKVTLDLSMPGMVMAANRVRLVRRDAGVYEGRCVIVRCPSGRKVWRAGIDIYPSGSKPASVDFTFRVAK
jgi:hypothetical protein